MSTEVVEEFDADYTGRHFLSVEDMSSDDVMRIIERGRQFKAGDAPRVEPGHVAINMFFENSTRTMTSFQMAEHRLGMKILDFDPGHSSVTKGEPLRLGAHRRRHWRRGCRHTSLHQPLLRLPARNRDARPVGRQWWGWIWSTP